MTAPVHPASDLDRPDRLKTLLGGFWDEIYTDQLFVASYTAWRARLELQSAQTLSESIQCLSRYSTPLWHTERWYRIAVRESDMTAGDLALPYYGEAGLTYGGNNSAGYALHYGRSTPRNAYYVASPAALRDIGGIYDAVVTPQTSLQPGIDFTLDVAKSAIVFRNNPFDAGFALANVFEDGAVVDREIVLWLNDAKFERNFMQERYGTPVKLVLGSSQAYSNAVNALWDGLVSGSAYAPVASFLAAVADSPIALAEETVQYVVNDAVSTIIATDQHAYACSQTATPQVAVGDSLKPGDLLTDAVQLYELQNGQAPAAIRSLLLGREFLAIPVYEGVSFANSDEAVTLTTENSVTRLEFPVGGWPADVQLFWDHVHAAGVTSGTTLAHLLDQRPVPDGEPTAGALPTTINPLEFVISNLLRDNAAIAVLKPAAFGPEALPLASLNRLRALLPPHTTVLLLVELAAVEPAITMEAAGTADAPGYEETVSPVLSPPSASETIDAASYVTEEVTLRLVGGFCE